MKAILGVGVGQDFTLASETGGDIFDEYYSAQTTMFRILRIARCPLLSQRKNKNKNRQIVLGKAWSSWQPKHAKANLLVDSERDSPVLEVDE